jgi:hypothetical protein
MTSRTGDKTQVGNKHTNDSQQNITLLTASLRRKRNCDNQTVTSIYAYSEIDGLRRHFDASAAHHQRHLIHNEI